MNDYISRQWLVECAEEGWIKFDTQEDENRFVHLIRDIAPSAQPEQRWIPCSERLPEAQTEVIVSCTDDSGDTKFRYTSSGWVTTNKEYWIVDNEINNFVVAWREMPEPYKEGNDG